MKKAVLAVFVVCSISSLALAQSFSDMVVHYQENGTSKTKTISPGENPSISHDFSEGGDLMFVINKDGSGSTTFEFIDPSGNTQTKSSSASYWTFYDPAESGTYWGRCAGDTWARVTVSDTGWSPPSATFEDMDVHYTYDGGSQTHTVNPGDNDDITADFDAGDLMFVVNKGGSGSTTFEFIDPSGNTQTETSSGSYWTFYDSPESGTYWGRCAGGTWARVTVSEYIPPPSFDDMVVHYTENGVSKSRTISPGGDESISHDFPAGDLMIVINKGGSGSTTFEFIDPSGNTQTETSSASYWTFYDAPESGTYWGRCAGDTWARASVSKSTAAITVLASPSEGGTVAGSGDYDVGSQVQISASPNANWSFDQWNDGNTQNPRNITVPAAGATYTASFSRDQATITVTASPSEGGSVSGGGTYDVGSQAEISASANQYYDFTQWNDGSTDNPRTVTVPSGGASYTAYFSRQQATISVTANPSEGGTVSGGGTYDVGTQIQIATSANQYYYFNQWGDGNSETPRTITVPGGGANYTAYFARYNGTVTVLATPSEAGTTTGSGTYEAGSQQQISATANQGWTFTQWNDGNTDNPRTITVPVGSVTYTASFISDMRYHPADQDQNASISSSEVNAYSAAWKIGQEWGTPPNPIPIDYVTRAGYLWKQGEDYTDNGDTPPGCWIPAP